MSLTAIRPYFRSRLSALGFTEWTDPFNPENIPASLLDRSFHQFIESIIGVQKDNVSQVMEASVVIRLAFKGFSDPASAVDEALNRAEIVISDLINPSSYNAASPPITGVFLDSLDIEPFSDELNDNVVVASCVFKARIYLCVE